jgi:hypothetical protein
MSRWRRGEGPAGEERNAKSLAADSESLLLPFAITGQVTVWDPMHRTLEIGPVLLVQTAPGRRTT